MSGVRPVQTHDVPRLSVPDTVPWRSDFPVSETVIVIMHIPSYCRRDILTMANKQMVSKHSDVCDKPSIYTHTRSRGGGDGYMQRCPPIASETVHILLQVLD